jgi:signal transduction histidine kinase
MLPLFPKFDDKLLQLKHNTLVSYALFQLFLFIVIAILTYLKIISGNIFYITIFTTLIIPILVILLARYRYNLVAGLFIASAYIGITYFMFLIHAQNVVSIAIIAIILFSQSILAVLIIGWPSGLALTALNIVLLVVDHIFESHGIFNKLPSYPIPTLAFLFIIIPFLLSLVVIGLSYAITLKLIFRDYTLEFNRRKEYEELLIEKNIAVNEMNSELEESLAQLEETNDQLQIALRKAEESDKLKSSFLQNISHEVRTPLNAIMGFLNLIKETNVSNECNQDEFIDLTIKSGRHLLNIISDIVELSKINAGLVRFYESDFNLEDLVEEVYTNFLHLSENKQIELILENKIKGKQALISSDQLKITQILNNLISNGIKYTRSGSVLLSCKIKNNSISIKVKDTGIGIEKNKHKFIFEQFKQVEMDLSRSYGGLGIGLTIVKGLVDCMSGSVAVKSKIGKGSEFEVLLPYKPIGENTEQVISKKPSRSKKTTKIIIAEDDAHNYLYLERILKNQKLYILHAWNGKEAIELFHEHSDIQMVLMDIKMPVMDGLEALKQMKNFRPEVPVIAITAYALDEEKMKYRSYGFDGYLTKPVRKEDVLDLFR